MWSDLWIALAVFPWLFIMGFFAFIFLEWGAKDRGAQAVLRKQDSDVHGDITPDWSRRAAEYPQIQEGGY
jgi:hypothetical protein